MDRYIQQIVQCDLYNLKLEEKTSSGNWDNYIFSSNQMVLTDLILTIQKVISDYWNQTAPHNFVRGQRYWWVSSSYSGWLRTLSVQEGIIPDNCYNQPMNFFENRGEAQALMDKIDIILQGYESRLQC